MLTGESGGTADDSLSQLICLAFSLAQMAMLLVHGDQFNYYISRKNPLAS